MRSKGTPQELERRRLRAAALLEEGHSGSQVARMLGVTPGAVSQWKKASQRGGSKALHAKPHPGPARKLTAKQLRRLERLLLKGPGRWGYCTELWTLGRVAEVIAEHFGVVYDPSGVWHILRAMGWSCRKPQRRAREGDEAGIARWRKKDWPRIKKRATKRPNRRFPR